MQLPPSTPPQWSADGQWWWDGFQWRPRSESMAQPAPAFSMPPPIPITPSPGLRIFLLVVLGLDAGISGLFALFGVLGVAAGANSSGGIAFAAVSVVLLGISATALVGVAVRASWSRLAAIAAGVAVSLTCLGLVLGIPIVVAAWRAPNLARQRA
jgi:hypothetical protein